MHRVVVHSRAQADIDDLFRWVVRRAPYTAAHWLDRLQDAIGRLAFNPHCQPLAPENARVVEVELPEAHFGRRPYVLRIVFTI